MDAVAADIGTTTKRTAGLRRLLAAGTCALAWAGAPAWADGPSGCGPSPSGPPTHSCGAGPASLGSDPAPDVGVGNPINVVTGNKYEREEDLPALPGVLGLELVRHYNSTHAGPNAPAGILGRGWLLSYETRLHAIGHTMQILQADGTRLVFSRDPQHPSLCSSDDPAQGQVLVQRDARGERYTWVWPDGRRLSFDAQGKLTQILAPTGEFVSLQYGAKGHLLQVTDPQGRSLRLNYPDGEQRKGDRFAGVRSIDTPVGRYAYGYGSALPAGSQAPADSTRANLVSVTLPTHDEQGSKASTGEDTSVSGIRRTYHYEDPRWPTLLTGLSVTGRGSDGRPMNQRIVTWAYDERGRANLSVMGEPARLQTGAHGQPLQPHRLVEGTGIEQVALRFTQPSLPGGPPGQTVLQNAFGQETVYTHQVIAGKYRLLQVRGAGCASCGEANMRYDYDAQGRLTGSTRLDDRGQPVQTLRRELDAQGRLLRLGRIDYDANGKARPAQWLARYEYAPPRVDAQGLRQVPMQPTLIATPSVVPGKEHLRRVDYNDAGQPTGITETGFSPIDDQGQPSPAGTPIRRSTSYGYGRINGRSVLTQIDGPLPNGPTNEPDDSDVTRIEWDGKGNRMQSLIAPANLRARIQFDHAGRVAEVTDPGGLITRYSHDRQGRLLTISHDINGTAADGVAYRYDALGRMTEMSALAGGEKLPRTAQAFDAANRMQWQADALGILRQATYDLEGRLLISTITGAGMRQQETYAYDEKGRLQHVSDGTGALRSLVRDGAGRLEATIDPLGRWTRYEREPNALRITQAANTSKPLTVLHELDERGELQATRVEASDGMRTARTVTHQRWADDFGRKVAIFNPDSGREVRRFDSAGRVVQVLLPDGSKVDFERDSAGRLLRRTVTPHEIPSQGAWLQTVRYTYEANRLAQVQDPEQTERYAYDQRGRVTAKTVSLRLNDGRRVNSITHYRYDPQGRLVAQSLPDGSELQYERNGQGQIVALHRQTTPWAPFGWGRTTLVRNLQRDLVGLRQLTYGNGVQGKWQRSRAGVLARVAYTTPKPPNSALRAALERLIPEAKAQAGGHGTPSAAALGAFALPREANALWDSRLLFDAAGNIRVQSQFARSAAAQSHTTLLTYDPQDQLMQAVRRPDGTAAVAAGAAPAAHIWRYHQDSLGNRLLAQQAPSASETTARTIKLTYAPDSSRSTGPILDAAGRPLQEANRRYEWDGLGRLQRLTQDGKTTTYRYNRLGLRIAKYGESAQHYLYDDARHRLAELDARGRITRQYVWLADHLVAVIDAQRPTTPHASEGGFVEGLIRMADVARARLIRDDTVAYVHTNHLGAPIALTDEKARPVWTAAYAPFGQRIDAHAIDTATPSHMTHPGMQGIRLDLRLAGQWEDAESGLHYNDQRYYDPNAGRYLSPDPLGVAGGLNAYAYVGNNPMGYSDPLGLVLFAFDGTGNSDPAPAGDSISNVRKFYLAYDENVNGMAFYITGIGTVNEDMPYKGNMLTGDGFEQRITLGFTFLEKLIDGGNDTFTLDIDVVGFSRGAAEARVWVNRLVTAMNNGAYTTEKGNTRCLNLRFTGLWDTVPHLGFIHGKESNYDFGIPSEMKYVAHAVALNEHRGDVVDFDSHSIFDSPQTSTTPGRSEIGMVGSHADIGGGYGTGDLSDVALMWMVKQAKDQGIQFDDTLTKEGWNIVSNPIIHDKSGNKIDPQTYPPQYGDRDFIYGDGTKVRQSQAVIGANDTAWARSFVSYYPPPWCGPRGAPAVGVVDMTQYSEWLKQQGVDIAYAAPATAHPCE